MSSRNQVPRWLIASTAATVAGNAVVAALLTQRPPRPPPRTAADLPPAGLAEWPRVSIIVPARNEARNLPLLLPSLLAQAYPADRLEIVVVDDGSTDGTAGILAAYALVYSQIRVVTGQPLPPGWKGKPWAMQQGAAVAQGEWLLFTDADTQHAPSALPTTIYDAVTRAADLYTIVPELQVIGPAERLIMPVVTLGMAVFFHPIFVNNPRSAVVIANGQYLLFRRAVYDALGGVAAVHTEIAEDLELGRLVKRHGYRLCLVDGRGLMRVRMYHNLAELWEGWRKNVLLSMKRQPAAGVLQIASLLAGVAPFAVLLGNLGRALAGQRSRADRQALAFSTVQVAAMLVPKWIVDRGFGLRLGWTLSYPLGILMFIGILLDSARRLISGQGVTWKGRSYTS
ncbi:MAG: glycosyltransferase [Chloroflexota bacterium]|nr:glycosyltransferase [Chloroflexota bacterium]